MNKKEKRKSVLFLAFAVFLFLCSVINFAKGHVGAAVGGLGAGVFYLCMFSAANEKSKKDIEK